jgi:hypothetical protein
MHCCSLRTEQEIVDFERQHGIELPGELRTFLMTVRSGEPQFGWELLDYGYFPIGHEQPAADFQWDSEDVQIAIMRRLSDDPYFMWEEGPALEYQGYISLVSSGCGWVDALVVTGEQRGLTWGGGNCCWFPYHDQSGRQYGFLEWYEQIHIPSCTTLRERHEERIQQAACVKPNDEVRESGEFKVYPIYQPKKERDEH